MTTANCDVDLKGPSHNHFQAVAIT